MDKRPDPQIAETSSRSDDDLSYVEAVRQWGAEKHGGEIKAGSELERWIIWALQQADRIDPLVDSPPSILDEKDEPDFSIFR